MSGKIGVDELRVGMFIHLDLGWMKHPFPVSSFRITHAHQIERIRSLGLRQLRWSPDKSELAPTPASRADDEPPPSQTPAPKAVPLVSAQEQERRALLAAQRDSALLCQKQFDEAGRAWCAAQDRVVAMPEQARRDTENLTRSLLDKMLVDGDMCIRLLSCNAGDGASAHAMNVTVISLLMGRVFGLDDNEMLDLGTGALMHDVGKIDLPERLRHADERSRKEDVIGLPRARRTRRGARQAHGPGQRRAAGAGAAP